MVSKILATAIVTLRNAFYLAIKPYKTMRMIASAPDAVSYTHLICVLVGRQYRDNRHGFQSAEVNSYAAP